MKPTRSHFLRAAATCAAIVLAGCAADSPDTPDAPDTQPVSHGVSARVLENGSFDAELNGHRIHYEVHGRGPVMMVVPNSWGLSHEALRGLFGALEQHLTLVYFDPRGMGRSAPLRAITDMGMLAIREDFDALRRHLELDRVYAIGWANGAMNLMLLAADRPETIDAAIFLHAVAVFGAKDINAMSDKNPELMDKYSEFHQQLDSPEASADEQNEQIKRFNIEVWYPNLCADPETAAATIAGVFGDAKFSLLHARYTNVDAGSFNAKRRLGEIQARSLVVAGRHDLLPMDKIERVHTGIPGSSFVVFENSGHFSPVEEPELFRTTLLEFLGVATPADR